MGVAFGGVLRAAATRPGLTGVGRALGSRRLDVCGAATSRISIEMNELARLRDSRTLILAYAAVAASGAASAARSGDGPSRPAEGGGVSGSAATGGPDVRGGSLSGAAGAGGGQGSAGFAGGAGFERWSHGRRQRGGERGRTPAA